MGVRVDCTNDLEDFNEISPESLLGEKIYAATKRDKHVLRGVISRNGNDYIFVYTYCGGGGGVPILKGDTLFKVNRQMYYIRD